jgi:hypothetical protein
MKRSNVAATLFSLCVMIAGCTTPPESVSSSSPSPSPQTGSSQLIAGSPTLTQYPLDACGDVDTGTEETWYPVFIEGTDLSRAHQYCKNAFVVTRTETGRSAIQMASYSSYERALELAQQVGGEVGQPIHSVIDSEPSAVQSESTSVVYQEYVEAPTEAVSISAGSGSRGSGLCETPDDLDIRGNRCGNRAASVRGGYEAYAEYEEYVEEVSEPVSVTSAGSGSCNTPDDVDSRGRRCGKRAASVRPGGR